MSVKLPTQQLHLASLCDIELVGLGSLADHSKQQVSAPKIPTAVHTTALPRAEHQPIDRAKPSLISNKHVVPVENGIPRKEPQMVAHAAIETTTQSAQTPLAQDTTRIFVPTDIPFMAVESTGSAHNSSSPSPALETTESSGTSDSAVAPESSSQRLAGIGSPVEGTAISPEPEDLSDANADVLAAMEARTTQLPLNIYNNSKWATVLSEEIGLDEKKQAEEYSQFRFGNSKGLMFMSFGYREYIPRASFVDFEQALKVNDRLMAISTAHMGSDSWQTRELRTNQALLTACLGNDEKGAEFADNCADPIIAERAIRSQASLYFDLAQIAVYHDKLKLAAQLVDKCVALEKAGGQTEISIPVQFLRTDIAKQLEAESKATTPRRP